MAETISLLWLAIYLCSFSLFATVTKVPLIVFASALCITQLWMVYAGLIGQMTKNGKHWYRYGGHFSFLFTMLLYPNKWKECKQKWNSATITLLDSSRYYLFRYCMTLFSILVVLRLVSDDLDNIIYLFPVVRVTLRLLLTRDHADAKMDVLGSQIEGAYTQWKFAMIVAWCLFSYRYLRMYNCCFFINKQKTKVEHENDIDESKRI
eukprot:1159197_1